MAVAAATAFAALAGAASPALAQAPGGVGGSTGQLLFFGQLAAVFAIMYFLLIRPQQKKQDEIKKMQAALKKGDRVLTQGGILGTVAHVGEDTVLVKVDGETKLEFQRAAVVGIVAEKK
jgi:preprotein translocase subunit YajC